MTHPFDWPALSLALRSLLWTVLLPGLFAGYLPWRYFGLGQVQLDPRDPLHVLGVLCIAVGMLLVGTCIWEFARSGRGTLSPADPPRVLVVLWRSYRRERRPWRADDSSHYERRIHPRPGP